jgi:serine/threonine protein kinase
MVRLTNEQGDNDLIVCIFEDPGPNYLEKVVDFGPAWFYYDNRTYEEKPALGKSFIPKETVTLETFLDFAVGATECLEIFHRGERVVHGAIRGDAFTMNIETGDVKLVAIGSGLRSFENGLTSTAWSTLAREVDAKIKLCESALMILRHESDSSSETKLTSLSHAAYMSPEQTGRTSTDPDSRTDIYSLGILFWTMLTQQDPFEGDSLVDIIRGVLARRLPLVSDIRLDIPPVIGKIIRKATAKAVADRCTLVFETLQTPILTGRVGQINQQAV